MAKISITNGLTTQSVMSLTDAQVDIAINWAAHRTDVQHPAREAAEAAGATGGREWLEAFCEAHERLCGAVFAVG